MYIDILNSFIKSFILNIGCVYAFIRILNYKEKIPKFKMFVLIFSSVLLTYFECLLKLNYPVLYSVIFIFVCYSCIFRFLAKCKISYSILITAISFSIAYTCSLISTLIIALVFYKIYYPTTNYNIIHTLPVTLVALLNFILIYLFFRIKKFKNGFSFLLKYNDNEYFNIIMLISSAIIIFMYVFCAEITAHTPIPVLSFILIFFALIMILIIQKTFTLYQKHKLQTKTLKEYEQELKTLKQKLETALKEKDQIVKSNHEFYHRQEALSKKLDLLLDATTSMNTEFAEEYSNIKDRIARMSNEYNLKKSYLPNLERTNLSEIDDMLIYMQSECNKSNIEFNIKINYDLNDIIDRYITISQLETLLGDLIRNAVIAINHSTNSFRSIMVIFGIKDDSYELCIFDSGIPFEIETLINLGLQPASTHINEGGTGIGFVTTFETINSCNASFIINENTNSNYSKSLEIKFDNKHEYVIISNRKEKIKEMNLSNRKIILK